MNIYSYHLIKVSFFTGVKNLLFPFKAKGLLYSEVMANMRLGSSIFSLSRLIVTEIAVFAQWEDEKALNDFLINPPFGKQFSKGWFVKLRLVRQWGSISGLVVQVLSNESEIDDAPVVAVTVAKMKLLQIPRFIKWGRPVEKLVRDHSGITLASASIRFPNTVSTFSIWKTTKEMTDMVRGHSNTPKPKRHVDAMKERDRKDFHYEFTTLRFKILSESGQWNGKDNYTKSK